MSYIPTIAERNKLRIYLHARPKAVAHSLVRDCVRGDYYEVPTGWSKWSKQKMVQWLLATLDIPDYPSHLPDWNEHQLDSAP